MSKRMAELLPLLLPAAVTMLLVLAFFAIFDRWEKLADPINSVVTTILAGAGFGFGVAVDRLRISRARAAAAGSSPSSGTAQPPA